MGESHFRNLQVYRLALEVTASLYGITRRVPYDARPVVRQLVRASTSIVLNIAEGAGEYRPLEKARFYRIARRSSWETSAALDVLQVMKAVPDAPAASSQQVLDRVGAMLTVMIRKFHDSAATGTWPPPEPDAQTRLKGAREAPPPRPPASREAAADRSAPLESARPGIAESESQSESESDAVPDRPDHR